MTLIDDMVGYEFKKLPEPPEGFYWDILKIYWFTDAEDFFNNNITFHIDFILKPNKDENPLSTQRP